MPARSPELPEPDAGGESAPQPEPAPLSWEEEVKRALHPLDAFPRLLACADNDQPPSADDRFRFQWFGLFYQGPDHDAFVLRLRLPGGRLRGFQLLGVAEIVQELAGGFVGTERPGRSGPAGGPGARQRRSAPAGGSHRPERAGHRGRLRAGRAGRRAGASAEPPLVYGLVRALEQALAQSREFEDLPGPCEVVFRAADEREPVDGDAARLVFRASHPAPSEPVGPAGWPRGDAAIAPAWEVALPGGGELGVTSPPPRSCRCVLPCSGSGRGRRIGTRRERAAWASFCAGIGAGELRAALERELGKSLAPSTGSMVSTGQAEKPSLRTLPAGRLLSGQMVALARLATQGGVDALRFVQPGGPAGAGRRGPRGV